MNDEIDNGLIECIREIPEEIISHISMIESCVKVLMLEEVKQCIDSGTIQQDKLLDLESSNILISMLHKLICVKWQELAIEISDAMIVLNSVFAIHLYYYLHSDFALLSKNYGINKNDLDLEFKDFDVKKKNILNTLHHINEKSKYLEDCPEVKKMYDDALIDLEYKINYHDGNHQLRALFLAMEKAKIHSLLNVGVTGEKMIYVELLDIFKDYFYLKYAFYCDRDNVYKLKRNLRNNPNTKLTNDQNDLFKQLERASRNQVPSIIRHVNEEKYMHDFDNFKALLRQLFNETVNDNREFANYRFEEPPLIPLPFFKYTMFGR